MISGHSFRTGLALVLAAAVALVAMYAVRLVRIPPESFFPPSFVTHSVMLALTVVAMWLLSKGRFHVYGFTKGAYESSPRILMWVLPTAVLSILAAVASPGGQGAGGPGGFTKLQIVIFIWVYASISEEVLTRGLLQTLVSGNAKVGAALLPRLSLPVLVSGLFFGAMHLVLLKSMGPAAVPVILLAVFLGLVAAWYRERTGSLLPAIIVHALFNIGGTLPLWVMQWLHA